MYDFLVEITTANFWRDLNVATFWVEFVFRDIKTVNDASIDVLIVTSVIDFLIDLTEKNCFKSMNNDDEAKDCFKLNIDNIWIEFVFRDIRTIDGASIDVLIVTSVINFLIDLTEKNYFKSIDNDDETKSCFKLNIDDIFDEIITANRCSDDDCCKSNWNNRLNRSNRKIISRIEFSYSLINFIALFSFERLRQTYFSDSYFFHRTRYSISSSRVNFFLFINRSIS